MTGDKYFDDQIVSPELTARIHKGEFLLPYRYWVCMIVKDALRDGTPEAMRKALEQILESIEDKP